MDQPSDEREFLHDMASPLGTALFALDGVIDRMQSDPKTDLTELERMQGVFQALEKMKKMLQARREILIKRGVPSARK